MRMIQLLLLVFLIAAQAGSPSLRLASQCDECQGCCGPEGGCDAGCLACPVCSGAAPGDVVPFVTAPAIMPLAGALPREGIIPPPPRATEVLHVPRPALV